MTSVEPGPGSASGPPASTSGDETPTNPGNPGNEALCAALNTEYAVIYGYGIVSAHSPPDVNYLVSAALSRHRQRRNQVIELLQERSVTIPVAAAGYQLPIPVNNPTEAARLAVRMENDAATAWRAIIEQARQPSDRDFAVTALTQSAVLAARWNRVLGSQPVTTAFPGGQ